MSTVAAPELNAIRPEVHELKDGQQAESLKRTMAVFCGRVILFIRGPLRRKTPDLKDAHWKDLHR
jgi:hypothetical protein